MAPRKQPVWQQPPHIAAKLPPDSGNAINGLGERSKRPPTPVMWHRPDRIRHGALQQHVNDTYESHALLKGAFDIPARRAKPVAIAGARAPGDAAYWTAHIKRLALGFKADMVGIAKVDPLWVFEGFEVREPFIIVLGVVMDHAQLSTAPEPTAAREVANQYNRGTEAARALETYIRENGYSAHGHGGPGAGPIQLVPAALAAGFGELGKHGSIIHPVHGSSLRLAGVTTDLPLALDAPIDIGADDFCTSCQVCTNACPPAAIDADKHWVRGTERWYVDFDKCLPYFADNFGCGICIAVCPWSKPGTAPRLMEKMLQRRACKE